MQDLYLSFVSYIIIISIVLAVLKITKNIELNAKWLLVSLVLYSSYFLALFGGREITPLLENYKLDWNWGGKISAIILWSAVLVITCKLKPNFKASEAGFTLTQKEGSTKPAIMVIVLFILLLMLSNFLTGGGEENSTETIIFQAIMPGLDEEPIFRGILLYFVSLAVLSRRINCFGAQISIGGLLLVLLFSLSHGFLVSGGKLAFSPLSLFESGVAGFILLWLRERTGSLVFPIIAHNLVNLTWVLCDF